MLRCWLASRPTRWAQAKGFLEERGLCWHFSYIWRISASKQWLSFVCSSGGILAPSTTQFTVILKIVSDVRCKASLALLRWCTPKQAPIPRASVCAVAQGSDSQCVRPNRAQSGCWQHPPWKRPHGAHRQPSQRKNCLGSVGLDGWSNHLRHHVIIYNFQAITNSTWGQLSPIIVELGMEGAHRRAELREGLTLLAHKLQAFRSCLLKGP